MSQIARWFRALPLVRVLVFLLVVFLLVFLGNYTEKPHARTGTVTVKIDCGEKLVDLAWKQDNLWYATRLMREGEVAETYTFAPAASWGEPYEHELVKVVECNE